MSAENENKFHEEEEHDENYKAPAQKTIEEILALDNEDESLRKYKEALLGSQADKIIVDSNNPKNVIVKKLALIVQGRDDLELDLSGDLTQLKKKSFTIKEGIQYKIKIEFFVQREIVHGLKYVQKTYRLGVPVDKMTHMVIGFIHSNIFITYHLFIRLLIQKNFMNYLKVGSYPPKMEIQSYVTNFEEAPSGLLSRGEYIVSSLFTDDDKSEHLKWEWSLKVEKDW